QYFISTHSSVFLDATYVDSVFLTQYQDKITVSNATSRSIILNELGYTIADNLVSDLIILTEGPSDIPVIQHFLDLLGLYGLYNIKLWPLGGDIMDKVDLSIFAEKNNIIALIDTDTTSDPIRRKFIRLCDEKGIKHYRLIRYSIENYFTLEAIKSVFKGQVSDSITEIDPNKKLSDQLKWDIKKRNGKIAKAMTLDDIIETDLYGFLMMVKNILENQA
nr:hypothetical protein [Herpetosiphonaceae bacterium]